MDVDKNVAKMTEQLTELEANVRDLKILDENSQKQIADLQQKNEDWEIFTKKLFKDIKERQ